MRLAEQGYRRTHLLIENDELIPDLNNPALPTIPLASGTEVNVLRWHIPSPTGEEGPKGDIQLYDQVKVINTGKIGFIARRGNNEINYV